MRYAHWWGWTLALLLASCQKPQEAVPAPTRAAVKPPFDLGAIIKQVHFAFREEGSEFRAGHRTHRIAAGRDGRVELTAYAEERGSALALRTVEGSRRGERLKGPVHVRARDDGALELARGPLVEHLANTALGLHQSWTFERAPEGRGDLVVRVATSGAAFQGETAGGLHFRDPGSAAGVRYGNAVWIDARGEQTGVKARHAAGEIVLRVPAAVVDRSQFPAVLDPYVSPELQTDALLQVEASGEQDHARVATNGANYLVVWDDFSDPSTGWDIEGARVGLNGAPLDPTSFVICNAPGDQRLPAVADDNNAQYFVVWQDSRNTATNGSDIFGAVVPSSGPAAPVSGIPLVTNPGDQTAPSIAFDGVTGTNPAYFAAWADTRGGVADIFGAHLERDGGIRESGGFSVSNAIDVQATPAVAHDGAEFVVAWQDFRDNPSSGTIYARRVSSAGTSLFPEVQVSSLLFTQEPSVAGGSGFALVAWTDFRTAAYDVYGSILSNGAVQVGPFAISDAGFDQIAPSVGFDGTQFGAVWTDTRNAGQASVYGTAITTGGLVNAPAGNRFAISGRHPSIASSATNPLMVFTGDTTLGGADVYGSVLSGYSFGSTPVALSRSANTQIHPAVGFDGTRYLVVWEDNRTKDNSIDLWGARVSAQGQVLDPAGIPIALAPNEQQRPAVAGGNGRFAVTWEDYRNREMFTRCFGAFCNFFCYWAGDIWGTVVEGGDGGVLAPQGIAVSEIDAGQLQPAASFDGQDFFIAWSDDRDVPGGCAGQFAGPTPSDLYALRMTPDGVLLGTPGGDLVTQSTGQIWEPRIATLGDRHLVAWQGRIGPGFPISTSGANVAVVSLDGGLLSPPQNLVPVFSGGGLTVAAAPDRFWAAWQQGQTDGGTEVAVQSIDGTGDAGAVVSAASTGGATGLESGPALVHDGRALALGFHALSGGTTGIYAQWLGQDGTPLLPAPVPVNLSPGGTTWLRAASDGQGHALLTYSKFDPSLVISSRRARGNLVQLGDQDGAPCTSGGTCFSGFCVDGVCCENACGGGGAATSSCSACNPDAGSTGAPGQCRPRVQGTVCRPGPGCLDDARCDGAGATCPANVNRPSGTVCRAATDTCDAEETCTGQGPDCPQDEKARDGTTCGDVMVCQAGVCSPVVPISLYNSCAGCSAGGTMLMIPLALLASLFSRRRRPARWLGLLLLAALLTPLQAQAAEKGKPRLAFLGITGVAGISPEIASSFSEYLQSETNALGAYSVIGMGEIRQLLGLERQKQLAGCTQESSCVAEMVGALDADRAIFGDVSRLGDSMVLNITLMDLKRGKLLSRVGKRVPGSSVEPLLENARAILYELVRPDPALEGRDLTPEKRFGGLRVGVRGDADVAGPGVAPGVSADVSTRLFGGGLTVLYGSALAVRAEGRVYPMELARVRPFAGAGATVFVPSLGPVVGLRGVAGAEVLLGSFTISADVAYERFLTSSPLFHQSSVLLGAGVGYLF